MIKKIFSVAIVIALTVGFNCATFSGGRAGEKDKKAVVDSTVQKLSRLRLIQDMQSQIEAITREDALVNANLRITRLQGQIDLLSAMKEDSISFPKVAK